MKLTFGFGAGVQEAEVPEKNLLGVLHANPVKVEATQEEAVLQALAQPIGTPRLRDLVKPGEKIAGHQRHYPPDAYLSGHAGAAG